MMKTIRRWTVGLVSSFDWVISQVENHEALVNSAIQDVQEAGARAKVQLKRVRLDGENMRKRLKELHDAEELWKGRAIRSAGENEKRALECVRRSKRIAKEIADLEVQQREHARLEKQLTEDLGNIDVRLADLKRQKNLMRTRESRAQILSAIQKQDSAVISEIEGIFERWETKVSEYEAINEVTRDPLDDLESEFVSQEEEEDLKLALSGLLESAPKQA